MSTSKLDPEIISALGEAVGAAVGAALREGGGTGLKEQADRLISAGWKPRGNPYSEHCRWLDPTRGPREKSETAEILLDRVGSDGAPIPPIRQLVVTPAAAPMSFLEALSVQDDRDDAALNPPRSTQRVVAPEILRAEKDQRERANRPGGLK